MGFDKKTNNDGDILIDSLNQELPLTEEPLPIAGPNSSGNNNFLRAVAPRGTAFNKKTITVVAVVIGIIILFSIIFAFSPQNPKGETETALGENLTQEGQGSPYSNPTPEELNKVPGNYDQMNQGASSSFPELGVPAPPVIGSMNSNTPHGQYNNRNSYYIPTPPAIQPIRLTPAQSGASNQAETSEQKEMAEVHKSPIRFSGMNNGNGMQRQDPNEKINTMIDSLISSGQRLLNQSQSSPQGLTGQQSRPQDDLNMQDEKRDFQVQNHSTAFYAKSPLIPPISQFEVKAGTIVPVTLITGINSDLPGYIICQIRENVYDTVTGRYLLLPQGTKIIGTYDSKISYGQNRVMVIWTRAILPNGNSLDLQNMTGIDPSGYGGLKDKVNNHYLKIFGGVLLSTLVTAAGQKATEGTSQDDPYTQALAQNVTNVTSKIAEKNMNIQPTIEIRPGSKFNLFVDKDFILQPYMEK